MIKTTLFNKTILFTTICMLSFSCQKQELTTHKSITHTPSNTTLVNNLSFYNSTHGNSLTARAACNGWWDCIGFSLGVAAGDIIGAGGTIQGSGIILTAAGITTGGAGGIALTVVVGAVGAAGGSYAAYKTMAPTKLDQNAPKLGPLNINKPATLSTVFFEVGVEHNMVLHNHFFNAVPLDEYYDHKGIVNRQELDLLHSAQVADLYNKISRAGSVYGRTGDYRAMSQTLLNDHLITGKVKEVLDLFIEEYLTCTDFPQLEPLINYYMNQVDAAEDLSEDEKKALFGSFLVASQSPYYFSTN